MRRCVRHAAPIAVAVAALLAPSAAHALTIGAGSGAGLAVGPDGTAYIVWNGPEAVSSLQFCKLPRGATACATRHAIPGVPGTADGRAFVMGYEQGLVVVSSRFSGAEGNRATYAYSSRDGGANFDAGSAVGTVAFNDAIAGPGSTVSGTSQISGMRFQNVAFGALTTQSATLSSDRLYGGAIGLLDGAAPLVVFNDGVSGAQQFRRYTGSGDLNDVASWTPAADIGTGFFPSIAYGAGGLYLLSGTGTGPIGVRRWGGTSFGPSVTIAQGNSSTTDIDQDPGRRLHAALVTDARNLVHASSDDGTTWRTTTLVAGVERTVSDVRVAAAADHAGVVVWTQGLSGGGQEIRVARLGAGATPGPGLTARKTARLSSTGTARRRGRTVRATVSGRLVRPKGIGASAGCKGNVTASLYRGTKAIARGTVKLKLNCRFAFAKSITDSRSRRLRVVLTFGGNSVLTRAVKTHNLRIR